MNERMYRHVGSGSLSATERDARRRQVLLPNRTPIRDRSACVGACWPFSPTRRMTMQDNEASVAASLRRGPWNKGKLVGAKPPLRPKHVWSIRTKLQVADRKRDLPMFNLAIDSKLRVATLSPSRWRTLRRTATLS